jgi:hypothetical protein
MSLSKKLNVANKLKSTDDLIYKLIQDCLNYDRAKRPTIEEFIERVKKF